MPDLLASLHKHDFGHLRIIAGFWGLELESRDADSAAEELCAALLDVELARETVEILPAESRAALDALIESNGKMEWALFARKHGELREMGEARRDRERPQLKPISPAEILYYRGILEKDFFNTEKGAREFAYIPDDLFEILQSEIPLLEGKPQEPLGRPATPMEKACEIPATDFILDDATTYLAALRSGRTSFQLAPHLSAVLISANILNKKNEPQPEAVKKFLEASREDALKMLYEAWFNSQTFDELRLMPALACEGEWKNQPQVTREFLTNLLNDLPQNKWWSLPAFLRDLKTKFPDFQRPAGDYDSWFIKRVADGQYLRGFAYWDQVDGALVKYLIQTLRWLGQIDLAAPEEGKEFTAFRAAKDASTPRAGAKDEGRMSISSNGKITVSRNFSRAARYQISRFCEWGEEKNNEYSYHVTAASLKQAARQGLKAEQLLSLLAKQTKGGVPPALVKALKQWDAKGSEARVETHPILRVANPEIADALRNSKAGKFLGEALSPTAVVVKNGAAAKIIEALTELGMFAEVMDEE